MNTLERIQYHCALAITGTWKGTSLNKIYDELGWESLNDHRYCRRLLHFYKIQTNLTPAYLKDPLPPVKNHQYGTRSEHVLQEIKSNTDIYRGSLYPDSIRCWNRIGNALRNSTNFKLFKTRLFTAYRAVPKSIFGIHEPFGIKRIFQLRVCLSPLLEHKMNHNFLDTPSNICTSCNLPENLEHFFLYCLRYTEARQNFLDSIMLLNSKFHSLKPKEKTKFFLYGDYSLSNDTNKSVLKATLKFLNDTGRFS